MSRQNKPIDRNKVMDEIGDLGFFQKPAPQEESKETSFQESIQTSKPANKDQKPSSANYPKVTYQLNPNIIDMLDEAKHTLKKKYRLKVSLNSIVEEAIHMVCQDLEDNKETSFLVNLFTRKLEDK
jgi:hypothetical protein